MVDNKAVCHEAGHAIVALNFGLVVTGISVKLSIPTTIYSVSGATVEEACTVYAGGAAAEKVVFGHFDEASDCDRRMISNTGGCELEDFLDYAVEIIRANPTCHKEMRNEMANNWLRGEIESSLSGSNSDKLNFELLSGARLMAIWHLHHQ